MIRAKRQSRFIAGLLALAVFVAQSSTVFAAFDMFAQSDSKMTHCMMKDMASKADDQNASHSKSKPDCCKTSECANNFCIPHVNYSNSAIFNSINLLHSSVYTQLTLETSDQLNTGIDPSSLYRPPRTQI
jgi:hypothetical protein